MIVITGAGGFIGSCLVSHLNSLGHKDLILVDALPDIKKDKNLENSSYKEIIHRDVFIEWFTANAADVSHVFHYGARTDTAEMDVDLFSRLNVNYSKSIWKICAEASIPLTYASSAATYGDGSLGFEDHHAHLADLKPLNPYGDSKQIFDLWALAQKEKPPVWQGLKFFNVYGPNEYHKSRMASVIFHAFRQINNSGGMKLFRSHRPDYRDGEQRRDFIYVKDLLKVSAFLMEGRSESGIYNLGTGKARSFNDLVRATFKAMGREEKITYIDTPEDIRDTYQYYTEANMEKLKAARYAEPFYELEAGVEDYVKNYLLSSTYM